MGGRRSEEAERGAPVKWRWEKRCCRKWVSAENSRSCSLSTLMRTTALMFSRPLRSAQNDSTSAEAETEREEGSAGRPAARVCRTGSTRGAVDHKTRG